MNYKIVKTNLPGSDVPPVLLYRGLDGDDKDIVVVYAIGIQNGNDFESIKQGVVVFEDEDMAKHFIRLFDEGAAESFLLSHGLIQ